MTARVLMASYPHMPGALDIPALRAIVEHFEQASFCVELIRWPYFSEETDIAPTWQASARRIAESLVTGDHVLAFGCAVPITLVAVHWARRRAGSLTCATIAVPSATLEALDTPAMARVGSQSCAATSFHWVRRRLGLMMQGAADAEIDSHARRFMQEIDRERHDAFLESHESLDLTVELKSIDTPTLYLELRNDPAEPRAASDVGVLLPQPEGEDRALFKRFVPDTRFLELNSFPMKLHRTDVGREVWQPALSFMTEHSTNGARALPSRA